MLSIKQALNEAYIVFIILSNIVSWSSAYNTRNSGRNSWIVSDLHIVMSHFATTTKKSKENSISDNFDLVTIHIKKPNGKVTTQIKNIHIKFEKKYWRIKNIIFFRFVFLYKKNWQNKWHFYLIFRCKKNVNDAKTKLLVTKKFAHNSKF